MLYLGYLSEDPSLDLKSRLIIPKVKLFLDKGNHWNPKSLVGEVRWFSEPDILFIPLPGKSWLGVIGAHDSEIV